MTQRYQQGSLELLHRNTTPSVWSFRWYESDSQGHRRKRRYRIGSIEEYPNASRALEAVAGLRMMLNETLLRITRRPIAVTDLIEHYQQTELDLERREQDDEEERSYATKTIYRTYLKRWIRPRWGSMFVRQIRTMEVERWLRTLVRSDGKRLAASSKAKIRDVMHSVFEHAIRYEWLAQDSNPITKVRQSAKRERIPEVLEVREIQSLLQHLADRERVLVLLAATTGLRRSELFALQWGDIDFEKLQIDVTRSIFNQVVGRCKTEASRRPVPLAPAVAEELRRWQASVRYASPHNWVFAAERLHGLWPVRPDFILKRWIKPAIARAGITKRVGWHTFRHTFSVMLRSNGEDVKVTQELMRHANSRITLDIYTQAPSLAKRRAQNKVAKAILKSK
jgi:integrase